MANTESIQNLENATPEERAALIKLVEFQNSLTESESPEEKELSKMIAVSTNPATKKILQDDLKNLQSKKTANPAEITNMVKESGYSLSYVIRMGFSKIGNQVKYQIQQRGKEKTVSAEKENK